MLADFKPDRVVAFAGTAGTNHMISIAERANVPVTEVKFVFGSNLAGRHGKGAALDAKNTWFAEYGIGVGPTGWAYAIPTKSEILQTLPIHQVAYFIGQFVGYAEKHPNYLFYLTRVGCGLAGFKDEEIAPLFTGISKNVLVPKEWQKYVG